MGKNNNIPLSDKQKTYLVKMKNALRREYMDLQDIEGIQKDLIELKENEVFLIKVVGNGYYHESSKEKLNELVQKFKYLVKLKG